MLYNKRHDIVPPDAIYIGRGSRWGNPFKIGAHYTRAQAIEAFRQYLWQQIKDGTISLTELAALHQRDLACFCAPQPCHGEVLQEASAWAHAQLRLCEDEGCPHHGTPHECINR